MRSRMIVTPAELTNDFKDFWDYYKDAPLKGRDIIVNSMCPQLHGLFLVKLVCTMETNVNLIYQ
jgi:DNA helicase MCM9